MNRSNKSLTLLLVIALTGSSLIFIQSASAQTNTPAVAEFTLQYVDHSYDVPPQPTSSKDPYTGEVTTSTIPGYRVENKTIDVAILNPSGATYYNFRWKGHHEDQWHYSPFNSESNSSTAYSLADTFSVPFKASTSTHTVLSLYFLPKSITPGGEIDIQVQALYGNFRAVPYGHIEPIPGGPTYDFYFEGKVSDWSNTQVFKTPETANPSPAVPEFPAIAILPLFVIIPLIAIILLRKHAFKAASQYYKKQ
jgi:hypothetical protein